MAHDVFISYSSSDKIIADAVCAQLEANRIRCWIAPRDIMPGENYSEAIIAAIENSRVTVLILSENANNSEQIKREIERAVSNGKAIIPFRIQDIQPSRSLEYFISSCHWLDAISLPVEQHIQKLAFAVAGLIKMDSPSKNNEIAYKHTPQTQSGAIEKKSSTEIWLIEYLLKLMAGPKRFFKAIDYDNSQSLNRAFIFYLSSVLIGFILELPFIGNSNNTLASTIISPLFYLIGLFAAAGLIKISFRVLGGKAEYRKYLIISLYFSAISGLLWYSSAPISKGIVLAGNPELLHLFTEFINSHYTANANAMDRGVELLSNTSFLIGYVTFLILLISLITLSIIMWGGISRNQQSFKSKIICSFCYILYFRYTCCYWNIYCPKRIGDYTVLILTVQSNALNR